MNILKKGKIPRFSELLNQRTSFEHAGNLWRKLIRAEFTWSILLVKRRSILNKQNKSSYGPIINLSFGLRLELMLQVRKQPLSWTYQCTLEIDLIGLRLVLMLQVQRPLLSWFSRATRFWPRSLGIKGLTNALLRWKFLGPQHRSCMIIARDDNSLDNLLSIGWLLCNYLWIMSRWDRSNRSNFSINVEGTKATAFMALQGFGQDLLASKDIPMHSWDRSS